jgi:hypothetical protein
VIALDVGLDQPRKPWLEKVSVTEKV